MTLQVRTNEALENYHTFGLKAKSAFFVEVKSQMELSEALALPYRPILILGGGSNLFFTGDFPGLVIKNSILGIRVRKEDQDHIVLTVGGGVNWHDLVRWTIERNYGGLENLSLIPGTVGAAPIQNIGAYGVEFDSIFDQLAATEIATGRAKTFDKRQCYFGYRDSIFKRELKGQFVVTSVDIVLTKRNHRLSVSYGEINTILEKSGISNPSIKDVSEAIISIRTSKLPDPDKLGNAGSFFKNPVISRTQFDSLQAQFPDIPSYTFGEDLYKIPAAWLIERAGWKGYRKGDAGVYDRHALVLVNYGNASGREMAQLAQAIRISIRDIFGIELESEVNII